GEERGKKRGKGRGGKKGEREKEGERREEGERRRRKKGRKKKRGKEREGRKEGYMGSWFKKNGKRGDIVLANKVEGRGREYIRGNEDGDEK
ncbi:hypothetical protein ACC676_38685, partial [Rhizobium ruizarguesonis]